MPPTWTIGFEHSSIGPAHAVGMHGCGPTTWGDHRVRATGLWLFPRAEGSTSDLPGYGHMALRWGEFRVYTLEPLHPAVDPEAQPG